MYDADSELISLLFRSSHSVEDRLSSSPAANRHHHSSNNRLQPPLPTMVQQDQDGRLSAASSHVSGASSIKLEGMTVDASSTDLSILETQQDREQVDNLSHRIVVSFSRIVK